MTGRTAQPAGGLKTAPVPRRSDAAFTLDEAGLTATWNPAAAELFGRPASAAVGVPLDDLLGHTLLDAQAEELAAFLSGAGPTAGLRLELHRHPRTADLRPLELMLTRLELDAGVSFAVYIRELSGGDSSGHQLWLIERRFRALIEQIPAVVFTDEVEPPYMTLYVSPYIETLLGYTEAEWKADPTLWTRSIHPDDRDWVLAEDVRTNETGQPFSVEYRMLRRDGRLVWVREETVLVRDELGAPSVWQGVFFDISAQKQLERELAEHAFQDPLTGLPNRAVLNDWLKEATAARRPLALMFVDLDNFKTVNDLYGHIAADEIMVKIVQRIERSVRQVDLVARYGGDEFAIVLRDIDDPTVVEAVARRVVHAFRRPMRLHGKHVHVTLSIGVVYVEVPNVEPGQLLQQADAAMYTAKAHGRNRYELVAS